MKEEKIHLINSNLKVHVSIAEKWGITLQNAKKKIA
jgi:hypothetical protein